MIRIKAFDTVWHKGLLFKLNRYGFDWKLLQLLSSYLNITKEKVTFEFFASSIKSILSGVPHGSVFEPLLFLIYINGIANQLLSLARLFADHSSLSHTAGITNQYLIMLSN